MPVALRASRSLVACVALTVTACGPAPTAPDASDVAPARDAPADVAPAPDAVDALAPADASASDDVVDASPTPFDAATDAPALDARALDAASHDGSAADAASHDAASPDAVARDAAPADAGPSTRRVFVSSNIFAGNLGGVAGADMFCQTVADNASIGGRWRAWLSDSMGTSPSARFAHFAGDYVRMDGVVIAHGWTQLTSGTLLNPINVNERGGGPPPTNVVGCQMPGETLVWTGTLFNGTQLDYSPFQTCQDWSPLGYGSGNSGTVGLASSTTQDWSVHCTMAGDCPGTAALYCFEQ